MTIFRPCIDLHKGQVKQIVGGSLVDGDTGPQENFVSEKPAEFFAALYATDQLFGGHVIKLGPGNDESALAAIAAFPKGLQVGGGITPKTATLWLDEGASHVIVTSWLFDEGGHFQESKLDRLSAEIGAENLVIDLSCRRTESGWVVAMDRWQKLTDLPINAETLDSLATYADEFLIHAADVEGLCGGIDADLVKLLGEWGKLPITYAGGAASFADVELVAQLSNGKIDVTVGSALDIFGGSGVRYGDLVSWNRKLPRLP
jgi:phosphoribosylformimino-5-aminoimidazole carboxamide ribotide isomerase